MIWKLIGRKIFYPLVIVVATILWLVTTESGAIATFWIVKAILPGTLSAVEIKGKWIDKIKIRSLHYESPTIEFAAEALNFEPVIFALLDNKLKIPYFQLKEGIIRSKRKFTKPFYIKESTGAFSLNFSGQLLSIAIEDIQGSWSELPLNGYIKGRTDNKIYIPDIFLTLGKNQIKISKSLQNQNEIDWLLKINHPEMNAEVRGFLQRQEKPNYWTGKMTLYPGTFIPRFLKIRQRQFAYLGGEANLILNNNCLTIQFDFKQNNQNSISGELKTPPVTSLTHFLDKPLKGSLAATWDDLSLLYALIPQISKLKGALTLTGELDGTFRKPVLHLNATTEKTSFFIPKQNVSIKNFNLGVSGNIPGELEITGSGTAGDGQFQLSGTSQLKGEFKTLLKITGKNIEIYNTPNIHITATPEITVDFVNSAFYVQGTVQIPYGNITLRDEKNYAMLSKDVILVDAPEAIRPFKVIPSLYLIIENQLHFVGYGIDGIITGKLAIDQRPDGLLSGAGRLTIKKGKYRLQGATRYIHRGYLLFPPGTLLTDPILDIRISQKRIDEQQSDGDVGIYVQGTLQKPLFQPYSNTHLQSTQILSRLGFGGSESTNDESQRQIIAQSAFLLAGSANPLVDFLQSNLGLEEFNIESRETDKSFFTQGGTDTELIIGKSLSDKFYLQYVQSVLNPITTIRLKYFLSRYFTASAQTGTQGLGGDLTFSMERD